MDGNPEHVTDLEEDALEEENMGVKVEVKADITSGAGVPCGKSEENTDKDKRQKVADPKDDCPGDESSLQTTSVEESAADVSAEEDERPLVSHELAGADQPGPSSKSDNCKKNENIPTHSKRTRLTLREARMKAIATRAAKKREATLSGNLLACEMCVFKTCWPGVMARHVKAHAGYVPCACDFCDFKCRGIGLLDKHVIENHLDEMDTLSKKGEKMKNAKTAKNMKNESLPSSFEVNVKTKLYGPFGNRHRNRNIRNTTKQSSDIPPSPAAQNGPACKEVESHSCVTPASATNTDSLAKANLARAEEEANVLAMKLLASFDRRTRTCDFCHVKCRGITELEEHIKIHSPSLDVPQEDRTVLPMLDDLRRNKRSLQLAPGEDSSDSIAVEKEGSRASKELGGAEQARLAGECPPLHIEIRKVATQSSVTELNSCAASVSTSDYDPPKKCKVTPTGKQFKLGDLLRKKISLKLRSAEQSNDVTVGTRKISLSLTESVTGTEQGEKKTNTSAEYVNQHMKIHTEVQPYACDFCDFKGRGIKGLKKHMMIHTPSVAFR